jgi:hypothetical protein
MAKRKHKEPEESTQTPVTLAFDDFRLELRGRTERIEERHHKKYGRQYGLLGWLTWEGDDWIFEGLITALQNVFKPWRVEVSCDRVSRWKADGETKLAWVNVSFVLAKVAKPSLIPTEEEAWSMTMPFEDAARKVQLGIERAHKAWNDKNDLEDRAQQAQALRNWVQEQLLDGARAAVGFDEKVAALRAEVVAEVEQRAASRESEMLAGLAEADWRGAGTKFHPKAIEVGWRKGVESAVASAASSGRGGRFPAALNVSPEEVA